MIAHRHAGLLALVAITLSGPALAAPRYAIWTMSCAQAQAAVAAAGAVVMYTAQANRFGPETYERLVRHVGYCDRHEAVEPVLARSRDQAQCPVAYRCVRAQPILPFGR